MPGTRKLGRTTDQRRAMLRMMVTYLLENGKIETTVTRAKEIRPIAEKMITLGKENTLAAKRQVIAFVTKEDVVYSIFKDIAPFYADRDGGYTRIIRTGVRRGDAAEMAVIELVNYEKKKADDKKAKKDKKAKDVKPAKSEKETKSAVAEPAKAE